MNLTARLASMFGTSGPRRTDEAGVRAALSVSLDAQGTGARSAASTSTRLLAAVAATLAALLLAFSAQALATTGHGFAGSFGGQGEGEGQFSNSPSALAVGLSGDVDVSDFGDKRVQRYDSTGAFKSQFPVEGVPLGIAVDSSPLGGVYIPEFGQFGESLVSKYDAAGLFEYALDASPSEATLNHGPVAVDSVDGTVYTTATNIITGAPQIDSFSQSTGAFVASFDGSTGSLDGGFLCPTGLAVDVTHHVYVLDSCKGVGRVDKYSSAGAYEATVDGGSRGAPQAISTDPKTGETYVLEAGPSGPQITNFAVGGASVIDTFPAPKVGAIAVGPDGTVYGLDGTDYLVDRFTAFEGPTVTTEAASEVKTTSATFNGTVDAESIASKYHYEYGLDTTYGSSTEAIDAGSGTTANPAPTEVSGLVPNTTYHYRIVGTNVSGAIEGEDQTVTTLAAPPNVEGSPAFASAITPTGARLQASVNPEHSLTSYRIEYGTTTAYGSSAPEGGGEVGEQSVEVPVGTAITGLQPDTLYHFRVSAENGVEGPQAGADATFITAPAAAASASEVTTKKATLSGTIDPHGSATTYHFNYGPSSAYGASTPEVSGGSGSGEQAVSEHITGLSPSTTYHVQVVATTNGISSSGADGTFTTPPAPAATVSDPVAVTTSSATLQGAAETHGLTGSYHFEVTATEGAFATSTAEQALPAATGPQAVSVPVSGLPSGQSLRVRLIVTSNEATETSQPVVFATATPPPEGFPAPPPAASLYGCTAPRLNPVNGRIKPGATVAVSGSDLGLSGSVLLGEYTLNPTGWTATGFTIEVPADASGTLGLTVNCGVASNTIAIATSVAHLPSNAFTLGKASVRGSSATLTVRVPGPGRLQASGSLIRGASGKLVKAGVQTVRVKLSRAGAKALAKAKRRTLAVKVQIRFTPTGGAASSQSATVTFKRKGAHR